MFALLIACSGAPRDSSAPSPTEPADADGDGFSADMDCDDADASVFPGAPEVSQDGVDQDCDGADACSQARRWSPGDVSLESDADWHALCGDYDAVTGDLTLWSDAPAALQGCVCEVGGDLTLAAQTGDGLRGITAIGGHGTALWPHDLRSLQHAGSLSVSGMDMALERLLTVDGTLELRGQEGGTASLPALESVGGVLQVDLYLSSLALPALTQVGALDLSGALVQTPALTHVDDVVLGPGFVELDAPALESVSTLSIWGATVLGPVLASVGTLEIQHAVGTSLPKLTHVGALEGAGDAPELPGLTHLETLAWRFDADLDQTVAALWAALSGLAAVDQATLSGDVDLSGLPTGVTVDQLRLQDAALTGAVPDPGLIAGDLILEDLDNPSLAPLSSIQHIPAGLRILSCRSLTTLELDGLETVGAGLLLSRNGALPDSEIDALLDQVDVDGQVIVE